MKNCQHLVLCPLKGLRKIYKKLDTLIYKEQYMSRDDFEKNMEYHRIHSLFVFAMYKKRWHEINVIYDDGNITYFFYGSSSNCLMAECITKIYIPRPPYI